MTTFRFLLLLSIFFISSYSSAVSKLSEPKIISLPGKRSGAVNPLAKYIHQILDTSYKNLGYQVEHFGYPMGRSIVEANAGRIDGVLIRTDSVSNEYPNLIKVPFPLAEFEIMLVTDTAKCNTCDINQLDSLATTKGFKAFEYYLAEHPVQPPITEVLNMPRLLKMLSSGRVSGIVLPYHEYVGIKLDEKWSRQVLDVYPSYHFVHKKHAELIPRLIEQFKKLENDINAPWIKKVSG